VVIGDCVTVGESAVIGAGSVLGDCATVDAGASLAADSRVGLNVANCSCALSGANSGGIGIFEPPVSGADFNMTDISFGEARR
jgi:UDP-3-O-[3-hydroxymyristoyl] glucosamine N-acyltransferase